jgi:hypothetical protein
MNQAFPFGNACLKLTAAGLLGLTLIGCDAIMVQQLPSADVGCDARLVGTWQVDKNEFLVLQPACAEVLYVDLNKQEVQHQGSIQTMRFNGQDFLVTKQMKADTEPFFGQVQTLWRYQLQGETLRISVGDAKALARDVLDDQLGGKIQHSNTGTFVLITGDKAQIAFALMHKDYFKKWGDPIQPASAANSAKVQALLPSLPPLSAPGGDCITAMRLRAARSSELAFVDDRCEDDTLFIGLQGQTIKLNRVTKMALKGAQKGMNVEYANAQTKLKISVGAAISANEDPEASTPPRAAGLEDADCLASAWNVTVTLRQDKKQWPAFPAILSQSCP